MPCCRSCTCAASRPVISRSVLLGKDAPNLSPAVIARLKESWAEDYTRWQRRGPSGRRYVYFWGGGGFLPARLGAPPGGMVGVIGATPGGKKGMLGFQGGGPASAQRL